MIQNDIIYSLERRLLAARDARCHRTAAARARDMAKAVSEINGTRYEEELTRIKRKYDLYENH